jgi:drug/metabolite transporter (DMT)-like permease
VPVLSATLAALSGLVWGVGDFAGGKATQTAAAMQVAWVSKLVSLPLLAVYVGLSYLPPQPASLGWGALGGTAGIFGLILFYRALASGAMTVVAPITAVTSAAIPVGVGLASGDDTTGVRLVGVSCALLAIALVSLSPPRAGEVRVVTAQLLIMAVGSGVGFALFFIFLALAGDAAGGNAGLWPVVASQVAGLVVAGALLAYRRQGGWPRRAALRWSLVAGPFDMTANALFLAATRHGDLSVVAPLAALYPVTTVVLALLVDHERMRPVQVIGLGMAVLALILVNR